HHGSNHKLLKAWWPSCPCFHHQRKESRRSCVLMNTRETPPYLICPPRCMPELLSTCRSFPDTYGLSLPQRLCRWTRKEGCTAPRIFVAAPDHNSTARYFESLLDGNLKRQKICVIDHEIDEALDAYGTG